MRKKIAMRMTKYDSEDVLLQIRRARPNLSLYQLSRLRKKYQEKTALCDPLCMCTGIETFICISTRCHALGPLPCFVTERNASEQFLFHWCGYCLWDSSLLVLQQGAVWWRRDWMVPTLRRCNAAWENGAVPRWGRPLAGHVLGPLFVCWSPPLSYDPTNLIMRNYKGPPAATLFDRSGMLNV